MNADDNIARLNAQAAAARLRDAAAGVPAPSAAKSNGATPPNDGIQAAPPKQMRKEHASVEEWAKSARDAIADPAARKVVRDTILQMQAAEGELAKRDALFRGAIALEQFSDRVAEDLLAEAACERLWQFFDVPGAGDPEASVHDAVTDTIGRGLEEARERRSKQEEERSHGAGRQGGEQKAHTDTSDRKRDQDRKPGAWRDNMLEAELGKLVEEKVRANITERILREAGLEGLVAAAIATIEKPSPAVLVEGIRCLFQQEPDKEWRDHIEAIARERVGEP